MPDTAYQQPNYNMALDYLCVDSFIKTIVDARALATAFELRLIDHLIKNQSSTIDDLKKGFTGDSKGLHLLINLLKANRVVTVQNTGKVKLTPQFLMALQYRDLLEAKLEFSNLVVHDFADLFTTLIYSPEQFATKARIFDMFGYNRCIEYTPENYKLTKRWVHLTTSLTKYEAQVCIKHHNFDPYRKLLDIGGNSGEFVLQICKNHPKILATVFDLPLVCDIGLEHISSEPEAERIKFLKGNAFEDELPTNFDLISFKSMLHDWPDREAKYLLSKASQVLKPGGTILIFERGLAEVPEETPPYSMIPFLLFFHSYRSPEFYISYLEELRFHNIKIQKFELEMPFFLITGTRSS